MCRSKVNIHLESGNTSELIKKNSSRFGNHNYENNVSKSVRVKLWTPSLKNHQELFEKKYRQRADEGNSI